MNVIFGLLIIDMALRRNDHNGGKESGQDEIETWFCIAEYQKLPHKSVPFLALEENFRSRLIRSPEESN